MSKPYMCGDDKSIYIPSSYDDSYLLCLEEVETDEYARSYILTLNGTQVGEAINIPFDKVVKSGTVKTVVADDVPYEGAVVGDKYIDLAIDHSDDHVYIALPSVTGLTDAFVTLTFGDSSDSYLFNSAYTNHTLDIEAGDNVNFDLDKTNGIVTINAENSGALSAFPVGSVYVTGSSSQDPSSFLGGTWELFDAEFTPYYASDDTVNWESSYTSNGAIHVTRAGHTAKLDLSWTSAASYGDADFIIANIDRSALGFGSFTNVITHVVGYSDSGKATGLFDVDNRHYSGFFSVMKLNVVGQTAVATGNDWRFTCDFVVPFAEMDLTKCNKFYWRRTA